VGYFFLIYTKIKLFIGLAFHVDQVEGISDIDVPPNFKVELFGIFRINQQFRAKFLLVVRRNESNPRTG